MHSTWLILSGLRPALSPARLQLKGGVGRSGRSGGRGNRLSYRPISTASETSVRVAQTIEVFSTRLMAICTLVGYYVAYVGPAVINGGSG